MKRTTCMTLSLILAGSLLAAGCDDDGPGIDGGGGQADNGDGTGGGGNGDGSDNGDGAQQAAGGVNLTVNGLADGASSDVQAVPADGGDPVDLTAGDNDIPAGDYTIVTNPARAEGENVDQAFAGSNDGDESVTVSEDEATDVSVTYDDEPLGGSGRLWVANPPTGNVQGFDQTLLAEGGAIGGGTDASITGVGSPNASAFDADGNLWVADLDSDSLLMYTPQDLASAVTDNPAASVTIAPAGGAAPAAQLDNPAGLAFDSQGNLWVSNFLQDSLVGYTPDQLGADGSPAPAFLIEGTDGTNPTLSRPNGLALSENGVLWVANRAQVGSTFTLVAYTAEQLAAATNPDGATQPTPLSTIDDSGGSGDLDTPISLAFDSDGDLWASNRGTTNNLVEFAQADLPEGGDVDANAAITISAPASANAPAGIAFDNEGDLWVMDTANNIVAELPADQLVAGGTGSPDTQITGFSELGTAVNMSFNPAPSELPLSQVGSGG